VRAVAQMLQKSDVAFQLIMKTKWLKLWPLKAGQWRSSLHSSASARLPECPWLDSVERLRPNERFPLAQLTIYLAIDASRHEKWNGEENRLQLNN
jgi:hypothetical protein